MTKQVLAKRRAGGESGVITQTEDYAAFVGANEAHPAHQKDMLASEAPNLADTPTSTSDGEPKSVLLALAWSRIETLLARHEAKIFVGKGAVAVFFHRTDFSLTDGLVPTVLENLKEL